MELTIGGIVEAWVDSVPILSYLGRFFLIRYHQELDLGVQGFNIIENVKKITKYAVQVSDPQQILLHLEKATYMATTGDRVQSGLIYLLKYNQKN